MAFVHLHAVLEQQSCRVSRGQLRTVIDLAQPLRVWSRCVWTFPRQELQFIRRNLSTFPFCNI